MLIDPIPLIAQITHCLRFYNTFIQKRKKIPGQFSHCLRCPSVSFFVRPRIIITDRNQSIFLRLAAWVFLCATRCAPRYFWLARVRRPAHLRAAWNSREREPRTKCIVEIVTNRPATTRAARMCLLFLMRHRCAIACVGAPVRAHIHEEISEQTAKRCVRYGVKSRRGEPGGFLDS